MEKEHKNDLSNEELCVLAQGGDEGAVMLLLQNCGSYIGGLIIMLGIPPIRYRRELVEWGEIGVLESIRSFNPTMGTKFLTFAHYNILNELKLFLESFRIVAKEVNFPAKKTQVMRSASGHWNWIASRPIQNSDPWKKQMRENFGMRCWKPSWLRCRRRKVHM